MKFLHAVICSRHKSKMVKVYTFFVVRFNYGFHILCILCYLLKIQSIIVI